MTPQEELAAVQRAIAAILNGGQESEHEVNQQRRRIVRADLRQLYRREQELKLEIRRQTRGGISIAIPC